MNRFISLKRLGGFIGVAIVLSIGFFVFQNRVTAPITDQKQTIPSPKEGDQWETGKTYSIQWSSPGTDPVALFLIDKSLENVGVSVSISDRLYTIPNTGTYSYTVSPAAKVGTYKWCLSANGSQICSAYFEIHASQTSQTPPSNSYSFEQYPVSQVYSGPLHAIDWQSDSRALEFKTTISNQVIQNGINFAGKYSVATWGCGSGCQESTIIDLQTGKISAFGIQSDLDVSYKKDSRLFIVNPPENFPSNPADLNPEIKTKYFEMTEKGILSPLLTMTSISP